MTNDQVMPSHKAQHASIKQEEKGEPLLSQHAHAVPPMAAAPRSSNKYNFSYTGHGRYLPWYKPHWLMANALYRHAAVAVDPAAGAVRNQQQTSDIPRPRFTLFHPFIGGHSNAFCGIVMIPQLMENLGSRLNLGNPQHISTCCTYIYIVFGKKKNTSKCLMQVNGHHGNASTKCKVHCQQHDVIDKPSRFSLVACCSSLLLPVGVP